MIKVCFQKRKRSLFAFRNQFDMNKQVSIDGMLPYIGEFGKFQRLLDGVFCIMIIPQTLQVLIMYFAALSPPWKCVANSTICLFNTTLKNDDTSRCRMPRSEWEYTEPKEYSIVTQFDINCSKEWQVHLTTSIFFIGWGIGAIVLGWVADNYGRKIVLFPSTAILIIVGFINAFIPNVSLFIICRLIAGFFTPGTSVQMFILISELVGEKHRPFAGIILWLFFTLSLCILGLKAYLIRQWKLLFIVCTAPYLIVLIFYKFVPESVRWLRLQGKTERMMNIFERIAKWNKKTIPTDVSIEPVAGNSHKSSPKELFQTRKTAVSTCIQGYAWLVNGMVYYGLSLAADDFGGSLYRNYVLVSIIEFPAIIMAIHFCQRFGRKKTVMYPMFIGSVACVMVAFIPATGDAKIARILLGMVGKLCITVSFDAIYTWSVELYPTNIRAEGMGFLQVTSRIGAASAPWVAKGLKSLHKSIPFVFMGVAAFIAAGLLIMLPETKGLATSETTEKSDAPDMGVLLVEPEERN